MRIARSTVPSPIRSGQRLASFDARALDVAGQRVTLVLHGVHKTASSLVLRVSLTAGTTGPIVAGNLYTYGEGPAVGLDIQGRFFLMTLSLDITEAVRRLTGAGCVSVYLNILDGQGRALADETLALEDVEIHVGAPE